MLKRSTGIRLAILGTGTLAVYAVATSDDCRPRPPGGTITPGWHIDTSDPARECRSRSWRRTGSSSASHWGWSSSRSSSSSTSATPTSHQTTTSRGGFGGSGLFHSSGG